MDRLNRVHRAYRVQLPNSVINDDQAEIAPGQTRRSFPIVPRYVGIVSFLTCGAAVVVIAGFLALSIH